ncbi:hypothetical protein SISSUDRAFT_1050891 [Sistotremastrum suecicum HHB10207 ss-3]|uniref:ASX DEUBAD domain-containing protein n=1 Tax=Sistotremastrum suecicum HHB10207 ss-3 TaxID=1314776 RepID=A0A166AXF9_9AGAM|nr:hypothetical protein SISSUDRAFT_1050891 [Sistotremastrum suecicum HHB10207 ss-3]
MLRVIKSKDAALQRDGANDHKRETSGMEEFEKQIKFLKDPAFQSAARTFQDHLAAGYYAEAHVKKSEKFHTVLKNGTAHVPWKDDVWLETHPDEPNPPTSELGPLQSMTPSSAEASEKITLAVLAKKGVLREGDILSYRRTFRNRTVVVTWDFVLESIHPKSLTFVFAPTPQLPSSIRMPFPAPPEPPLQLLDVQRPSQIENVALDHDGRIEKSQKTATNAWKSFSVWRWTDDFLANIAPHLSDNPELIVGLGDKGGRESCGSLFYLRDSFVKET